MPSRKISSSKLYHVYSRGNNKIDLYKTQYDVIKFHSIINDSLDKFNYKIHAFCIMNNHYHLLIEDSQTQISEIMHLINLRYAKYFNFNNQRTGKLFEREFQSKPILTETYFLTLIPYIHNNWSKAGYPLKKLEAKLCSYASYFDKKSILQNLETNKALTLLDNNINKFIDIHERNLLDFNPKIKNSEQAFFIKNQVWKQAYNESIKMNLLVYLLKRYNSNSSLEIQTVAGIKNIATIRSKIYRTNANKDLYEDYKNQILENCANNLIGETLNNKASYR